MNDLKYAVARRREGEMDMRRYCLYLVLIIAVVLTAAACGGGDGGGGGETDITPPSVPENLSAIAVSSSEIDISWDASTDDVGVYGYKVYRNGVYLFTIGTRSYWNFGLTPSTAYCYTVSAVDGAGNESAQSSAACATTHFSWTTLTIDSDSYVGEYSSIAVDSNNNVHISYYKGQDLLGGSAYDLKYATNASGAWVTTTIDSTGTVGTYTSLAIDSNDNVHISYRDEGNGLKYATNASGSWVTTVIDSNSAQFTSLALDSNDKVHISYYEGANSALKYATNASGSWATTIIDNGGIGILVGWYSSIVVDFSNDKVHISYWDFTNSALKYATNASGAWAYLTVDNSGYVGQYSSIDVDVNSKAHISYFNNVGSLKYASDASGSWVIAVVDPENVGGDTSIAVDADGKAHISYQGNIFDLNYATNASGTWVINTVDHLSQGMMTSIALDSNNKAHISYYDYGDKELMYATNQ